MLEPSYGPRNTEADRPTYDLEVTDGSERQIAGSFSSGGCCENGVDGYALIALLAGIGLATYFLRYQIIILSQGRQFPEDFKYKINNFNPFNATVLEWLDFLQDKYDHMDYWLAAATHAGEDLLPKGFNYDKINEIINTSITMPIEKNRFYLDLSK